MADTVSVGICAHNEEETIAGLLDDVFVADIPLHEVIVVVAGDDKTAAIVHDYQTVHDQITVVPEEERRGQTAAQNEILARVTGDVLFLVDGDGRLAPGSLERMLDTYTGENIVYGREMPVTDDSFAGAVIDTFWELHHELSLRAPKFTTQIALIPADLVDHIPEHIVLDDEFLGLSAQRKGYDIQYVPQAVKHHHVKGDIRSHIRHNRKNWAGMLQIKRGGATNLQPFHQKAGFYLSRLLTAPIRRKGLMLVAGAAELVAFLLGYYDHVRGTYPRIWRR